MNLTRVLLYIFIAITIINIGLWYPLKITTDRLTEMDKEFNDLDQRLNEFKVFDDSLIGNQNFKKKILDTVSTVSELQQVKANKKRELEQKLSDFKLTLEDRNKLTKRLKLFESARVLTNGLFVTLALILIIGRATKLNKQN